MEALRALKRRLSDVIYRRLVADAKAIDNAVDEAGPGGHFGATQESSAVDLPPNIDTSDKPLPGPASFEVTPPATAGPDPFFAPVPDALSQRRPAAAVKRSLLDGGEDRRTIDRREWAS